MDLTSTIIGLVILGLFIVPIAMMSSKHKKKSKAILNQLKALATENNDEIGEHDILSGFALGLSKEKTHVYFLCKNEDSDEFESHQIALNEIKNCKSEVNRRTLKQGKQSETIIDKIELNFSFKQKDNVKWMLYSSAINPQVDNELQLAEKWATMITNR